jgi:hypothetical protein
MLLNLLFKKESNTILTAQRGLQDLKSDGFVPINKKAGHE